MAGKARAVACEASESGGILYTVSGSLAAMLMALPAILSVRFGLAEELPAAPACQLSLLMHCSSGTGQGSLGTQGRIQNAVAAHKLVPPAVLCARPSVT